MAERLPLTRLPAALAEAGYDDPPNYRACYEAARSARIPARAGGNGRWTFDPDDLPAILAGLGLEPIPDAYAA